MARPSKANAARNPTVGSEQRGWGFLVYSVFIVALIAASILWVTVQKPDNLETRQDHKIQATTKTTSTDPRASSEEILKRVSRRAVVGQAGKLTISELLACLRDSQQSIAKRSAAANELAKMGTPEAIKALKEVLLDGPSQLKAAVAEALGRCPSPEALGMLLELVSNPDETTARAALRGLSVKGGKEAVGKLSSVLFDEAGTVEMRSEAALGLGGVLEPEALESLMKALGVIRNDVLLENVLDGLGHLPFAKTEAVFREFLDRGDISAETRRSAIEALGHTTDDATPFLLSRASDSDAGVRASVGWALALSENPGEIRSELLGWLKQEDDASVRQQIYQALVRQENVKSVDLLPLVKRETDADVRLAALGLLADAVKDDGASDASRYFETEAVSELKTAVYNSSRLDQSLKAVMALGRSGTPSATALLGEIANHPTDAAIRAAARQALKSNANQKGRK